MKDLPGALSDLNLILRGCHAQESERQPPRVKETQHNAIRTPEISGVAITHQKGIHLLSPRGASRLRGSVITLRLLGTNLLYESCECL